MARRSIPIEEKIAKAQEAVDRCKERYEEAVADLDALIERKDEILRNEFSEALANSTRTYDEIMEFLNTSPEDDAQEAAGNGAESVSMVTDPEEETSEDSEVWEDMEVSETSEGEADDSDEENSQEW